MTQDETTEALLCLITDLRQQGVLFKTENPSLARKMLDEADDVERNYGLAPLSATLVHEEPDTQGTKTEDLVMSGLGADPTYSKDQLESLLGKMAEAAKPRTDPVTYEPRPLFNLFRDWSFPKTQSG